MQMTYKSLKFAKEKQSSWIVITDFKIYYKDSVNQDRAVWS